jgi:hypothetical protein
MEKTDGPYREPKIVADKCRGRHLCATIDDSVLSQQGNETRGLT